MSVGQLPEVQLLAGVKQQGGKGVLTPQHVEVTSDGRLKVDVQATTPHKRLLTQVRLDSSNTLVYQPTRPITDMTIVIANNDSTDRTFELHHVPAGGSFDDTNVLYKACPLATGEPPTREDGLGMNANDELRGLCSSANTITVSVYGVEL